MTSRRNATAPKSLSFEKVRPTEKHVAALYALLQRRTHSISHQKMPSLQAHRRFVIAHPYRAWYLVKSGESYVGSIYLLDDNGIGVNIEAADPQLIAAAISYITARHRPRPAIKSVRAAGFHVNTAPDNRRLKAALQKIGARPIQVTYTLRGLTKA